MCGARWERALLGSIANRCEAGQVIGASSSNGCNAFPVFGLVIVVASGCLRRTGGGLVDEGVCAFAAGWNLGRRRL
jgi:hypothetical protein